MFSSEENQGLVVWLMGPTSSGKTTLAEAFARRMHRCGVPIIHFDGDEVRGFFGPNHGFRASDRLRVVQTLVHLADKSARAGLNVVVSALTASETARRHVRHTLTNLMIGYLDCSVHTCARRDPKGLYQKAARGEIDSLIGFNTPYVPPVHPDMVLNTETLTVGATLERLEQLILPRMNRAGLLAVPDPTAVARTCEGGRHDR